MRTYDSIQKISKQIIDDGLCEAIIIKGSIGRGDDDEFSDVDMYAIVEDENMDNFLNKRIDYLKTYLQIVYCEKVNFVSPQLIVIFENGLHFDLYTTTEKVLSKTDKIKVIYDPKHKFTDYDYIPNKISNQKLADIFKDVLYYFVEADSAYCRKNYPWTAYIMNIAIKESAILIRTLFDKDLAYLGLKKINEIIPEEQFTWIKEASENLNANGFRLSNETIIKILEYFCNNVDDECKKLLDLHFFEWVKCKLHSQLFHQ